MFNTIGKSRICFFPLFVLLVYSMTSCKQSGDRRKHSNVESIIDPNRQLAIFKDLTTLATDMIPGDILADSLCFLILPIQASCPACRKKTIEAIAKKTAMLDSHHFIIISSNGGTKLVKSYFLEQSLSMPINEKKILVDSINLAFTLKLYEDKPTMYYTHEGRVFERVLSTPYTVKKDLKRFFDK